MRRSLQYHKRYYAEGQESTNTKTQEEVAKLEEGRGEQDKECGNAEGGKQHGSVLSVSKKDLFLYSCVSSHQENFLLTLYILQMAYNLSGTNHHSPSRTMPLACIYLPACFLKGPLTTVSPNSCHNCRTLLCLKTLGDIFRKIRLLYWPLETLAEPTLITLLYVKNDCSICLPPPPANSQAFLMYLCHLHCHF